MTSDKLMVPSLAQDDQGNLQIYIPKNDFGEFTQGLLAQPRTLLKTEKKIFDIDHAFVKHLNEVIKQRVQSQQAAKLVSFQASIFFSDGRVQTVTAWEAFDVFADNSDSTVTKADLVWNYLVQFPSKPIPEKQTVALTIDTGVTSTKGENNQNFGRGLVRLLLFDVDDSQITVKVEYTEMTWGLDVWRHLDNEIRNRFIKEGAVAAILKQFVPVVGFFFLPVLFLVPNVIYYRLQEGYKDIDRAEFFQSLSSQADFQQSVIKRLDYLMADHSSSPFNDTKFWIYIVAFFLIMFSFILFVLFRPRSYLLLNSATIKYKHDVEQHRDRLKTSAIAAIALGVVAEILGARISEWLARVF